MFVNSATPATQNVTTITGATYTVTVTGSGSLAGSSGASGTATEGSPVTYVATGTTSTWTLTGSLTKIQMNRGSVATEYLATGASIKIGIPQEYDTTNSEWGILVEPQATNLVLTLSIHVTCRQIGLPMSYVTGKSGNLLTAQRQQTDGSANSGFMEFHNLAVGYCNDWYLQCFAKVEQHRSIIFHHVFTLAIIIVHLVKRNTRHWLKLNMIQDNGSTWTEH